MNIEKIISYDKFVSLLKDYLIALEECDMESLDELLERTFYRRVEKIMKNM